LITGYREELAVAERHKRVDLGMIRRHDRVASVEHMVDGKLPAEEVVP